MATLSIISNLMGGNIIAICAFSLFGIILAYFTITSAREWSGLYYLSRHGVLYDAKVTNVMANNTGRGTNFFIKYSYAVDDISYKGKQQISRKHYEKFQQQDYVTVRYVPQKQNWSRLAGSDFDNTYRNFSSYVAFAACLAFAPFIALWIITLVGTYMYLSFGTKSKR